MEFLLQTGESEETELKLEECVSPVRGMKNDGWSRQGHKGWSAPLWVRKVKSSGNSWSALAE